MGLKSWLIMKAIQGKFPLWAYRIAGKETSKILKREDSKMADAIVVDPKPWYQSKAKLSAIIMAIVAAIQPVSTAFGHPIQVPLWVIEFLTGLGIYGVRDAIKK